MAQIQIILMLPCVQTKWLSRSGFKWIFCNGEGVLRWYFASISDLMRAARMVNLAYCWCYRVVVPFQGNLKENVPKNRILSVPSNVFTTISDFFRIFPNLRLTWGMPSGYTQNKRVKDLTLNTSRGCWIRHSFYASCRLYLRNNSDLTVGSQLWLSPSSECFGTATMWKQQENRREKKLFCWIKCFVVDRIYAEWIGSALRLKKISNFLVFVQYIMQSERVSFKLTHFQRKLASGSLHTRQQVHVVSACGTDSPSAAAGPCRWAAWRWTGRLCTEGRTHKSAV